MSANACDVCVIGAGPAGLATAIAMRQQGSHVIVVDCATPPIDKACGEGLMPGSMASLRELGIEISSSYGHRFAGVRFTDGLSCVTADFPGELGVGIRRTVLHGLLLQRAQNLDVLFFWGTKKIRLEEQRLTVDGNLVNAGLIVGADGQNSQIRRQAGLNRIKRERRRYGFRRHYRIAPWSPYMEVHWGPRCQIYVTPVAEDEVCIALLSQHAELRLREALTDFPQLENYLKAAPTTSIERGAISVSRSLHSTCLGNIALVGDASGSLDAITGEGIDLSFRQALALARTFKSGDLCGYEKEHRNLSRTPQVMASLMLTLEKHKRLERRALASLARHPEVLAALLAIHVRQSSFRDLPLRPVLNFGAALLNTT